MNNRSFSRDSATRESSALDRLLRYGPLFLWMVFISFASTNDFSALNTSRVVGPILLWLKPDLTDAQLTAIHFAVRKLAHFTEYGLLAFLASRTFLTSSLSFLRRHWFLWATVLVLVYSLIDEFHQTFVPSRSGSIYDSAIDTIGGLTVLLIVRAYHKRSAEPAHKSQRRAGRRD